MNVPRPCAGLALIFIGLCTPCLPLASSQESTGPTGMPTAAPPKALTLEQRADIFMARKNYADAADYYYQALKNGSSSDPVVWNKLGISLQQQTKFHTARQAYSRATHLDKTFAEAWNNIGTTYFLEKKVKRSVKYYQHAITVKPASASFHLNLGVAYSDLKRFPEAVQEYREALGLDPEVLKHQSAVGTTMHAGGSDVDYYFYMAKAFASMGDAEDAVHYLRRALEDGFSDHKRIDTDKDFQKISKYPAFVELMKSPPVAIKD